MGRGKSLKTLKKQSYETAKAEAKGRLAGEEEAQRKKGLDVSLKEHAGKFIDQLGADGAVKIASIIGLTYIIKPMLDTAEEIQAKMVMTKAIYKGIDAKILRGVPVFQIIDVIIPYITPIAGAITPTPEELRKDLEKTDYQTWILAFVVACLVVEFGPALIQSLGGIVKLAGLLLT